MRNVVAIFVLTLFAGCATAPAAPAPDPGPGQPAPERAGPGAPDRFPEPWDTRPDAEAARWPVEPPAARSVLSGPPPFWTDVVNLGGREPGGRDRFVP